MANIVCTQNKKKMDKKKKKLVNKKILFNVVFKSKRGRGKKNKFWRWEEGREGKGCSTGGSPLK